jgi:CheY-like chemotaxis protein
VPDDGGLRGLRALVVDDHPGTLRQLRRRLGTWGVDVTGAATATAALRRLDERRFDVAVVDGPEWAAAVRERRPDLPVVLLTALTRVNAEKGDAAVVAKPVRPAPLYRALANTPADPVPPGARRILVAEDHPVNQRLALLLLQRLGLRADLVSNGLEAVAAVRERHYDVVLMDVRMPELDGLAATRRIRADGAPGPWIVAVTAESDNREACRAAGMDDHLTKPLVAAELAEALARSAVPERHPRRSGTTLLDPASLERLRELAGSDLPGLVAEFLAEAPALVAALDGPDAARAAHTLAGLAETFGAGELAALCRAENPEPSRVDAAFEQVRAHLADV